MPPAGYLMDTRANLIGGPGLEKERPALSLSAAQQLAKNLNVGRNEHNQYRVVEMGDRPFVTDDTTLFVTSEE